MVCYLKQVASTYFVIWSSLALRFKYVEATCSIAQSWVSKYLPNITVKKVLHLFLRMLGNFILNLLHELLIAYIASKIL